MGGPSKFEKNAWKEVQSFRDTWWRRAGQKAYDKAAGGVGKAADAGRKFVDDRPKLRKVVDTTGSVARRAWGAASDVVPQKAKDWTGQAVGSTTRTIKELTQVGLSPERVIQRHRKLGHPVERLLDIRELDLELVDKARGKNFTIKRLYPLLGGGAGAGSAVAITGGGAVIVATGGAAAAPGAGVVVGALAADVAATLALMSRATGAIGLSYGYDPHEASEKLFVSAVVNAGSAGTSAAKVAAMRDLSYLTQKLFRNQTWAVLNKSKISSAIVKSAQAMSVKLTKQGLGKFVPGVGAVIGFGLNYDTVSHVIDTADMAYRRRFLLEKYPHLAAEEAPFDPADAGMASDDEDVISIVDMLDEEDGQADESEQEGDPDEVA